ncbi:hypothetical protein HMPREF9554_00045 [Treponema phagedenis F0421]|nr:hypothetical protein HMPREF9554_00045 [Treponema phagedenis F0421]
MKLLNSLAKRRQIINALPMVSLLTVAQFQAMFCLTRYCKQAKLVGEPKVKFQGFAVAPCRAPFYNRKLITKRYTTTFV